ncbi:MAG: sugar transferase [Lachnospiraceae bacterium]|nr:sugar transferase [Lachnospiraceae bacterium]
MYNRFFKRFIDLVLSSIGIVIAAIPMLIVAVLIKADSPGPVFFRQKRVGINKTHFMIMKFRSMPVTAPKDTPTHELKDASSLLSPFQEAIRKYSIDELPQLFNIFAGQMSFVGPRPALWNQYDLLEERDKYGANGVKPGLTGWAQINGRDELPIAVKAAYDGEYVKNLSFAFDVKCFFRTFFAVAKAEGVTEGGTGSMESAGASSDNGSSQNGK